MEKVEKEVRPDLQPEIHALFEPSTRTWQYICACPWTRHAVIIDPVLDENRSGIQTNAADNIMRLVRHHGYIVDRILETHNHSSHASAAWYLRTQLREGGQEPRICTGRSTEGIRRMFARKYGMADPGWTGAFDVEFSDGEFFRIGELKAHVLHLPGYMSDSMGFMIGRNVFAGDFENTHGPSNFLDEPLDTDSPQQEKRASPERLLRLAPDYRIYKGHNEIPPLPSKYGADDTIKVVPSLTVEELRARLAHTAPRQLDITERRPKSRGRGLISRSPRSANFPSGITNGS